MLRWIVQYWLQVAFGLMCAACTAAFAYLRAKLRRQGAVEKGVKALLYDRLWQAYHYHEGRGFITVAELKNVEYMYTAYHALDGNGTGTELFERMKRLPVKPAMGEDE